MSWLLAIVLGLAHGMADGSAGLQLGVLARTMSLRDVALFVLLYNVLAFAGQPLVGLLVDRLNRPRLAAVGGLALHCCALVCSVRYPALGVTFAGLGSAAFHVGGGSLAIAVMRGRASGIGLFAGPGVLGLAIGGALAISGFTAVWLLTIPLIILAGVLGYSSFPAEMARSTDDEPLFEGHDLVMMALLAGIALRSAVWTTFQFVFDGRYEMLLAMACAAAIGKVAGGFLADRIGWRRWVIGALALSAPLMLGGQRSVWLLLPGVALLQSTTPVCLAAAARMLPRYPATATGLVLGLAVAAGGVPALVGLNAHMAVPEVLTGATLVAALAIWWSLTRFRQLAPQLAYSEEPTLQRGKTGVTSLLG